MTMYWYFVGGILMAMFVVGSRNRTRVSPATEIFVIALWPFTISILVLGTAVAVVRIIWKGDHRDE